MVPFSQAVQTLESFLLCTHMPPDGDGLGSQMALHGYLKSIGKKSYIVNPAETPAKFAQVDPKSEIQVFQTSVPLPKVQAVVIVDTNETKMLGPMEKAVLALGCPVYFVDHHLTVAGDPKLHLLDEHAGASGEIVYRFIKERGGQIDLPMAIAIYVAVVSDTGGFRFKRTRPETHHLAADLLSLGVKPEEVFQKLYCRESVHKIRALGHTLAAVQLSDQGRLAWISLTEKDRLHYGASIEDTEAFINSITLIAGVQIAVFFREEPSGVIKISLRGTGHQSVIEIAQRFGGGGHRFAAGARVTGKLEPTIAEVLASARTHLA